jgi:hypothetical protein
MKALRVSVRTSHQFIAGVVLAMSLAAATIVGAWAFHHSPAHGGAFEGPCTYQAGSPTGAVARLTLTDYGPPVQVHYLIIEERDAHGIIINANRVEVGTTVGQQQTEVFTAPAISGAASCQLLNWG